MDKPLRILCVMSTLDWGGAESMCMNLYRNIDRTKVQFDFVKHSADKGAFEHEIQKLGGRIFEAPRYKVTNYNLYCNWWQTFLSQHPEYRIVHGHFFTISSIYFGIAKKLERNTIGHIHSFGFDKGIKRYLKKRNLYKIGDIADFCFSCSEKTGRWAYKNQEFTVLKNAIDTNLFQYSSKIRTSVRNDLGISNELVIGVVGSIHKVKNPVGVLDIFENILKRKPNTKLLWVGDGNMRCYVEKRIIKDGIQNHVILTGVRSDVHRLMQAMDVFIFPSLIEGLGMVAIEAQAAGLPCLCSDRVPREAGITDLCEFLPLNDLDLWAEKAFCKRKPRSDRTKEIKKAGYDIHDTAKWLQEFYLSI